MITYKKGNLLEDNAKALVNTVNCVGVMGKGIALAFKNAFPDNYLLYRAACAVGKVRVGELFVVPDYGMFTGAKLIINIPTKTHWRFPSEYAYVEAGLAALRVYLGSHALLSLAMPAPGCENGGLNWEIVKPMVEKYLADIETDIRVYEPE